MSKKTTIFLSVLPSAGIWTVKEEHVNNDADFW
jgi:hypothetical protein